MIDVTARELLAREEADWLDARLADPSRGLQAQVVRYREPCVILGRSQASRWTTERLRADSGMDVFARASGGGVVLAGPWMVGVSVVAPVGHPLARCDLMEAYRWFGLLHERAMHSLGAGTVRARPPTSIGPAAHDDAVGWVCFASLSGWEVADGDRKLCGLAQVRRHRAVALVAGTLVQRPPWERLAAPFGCSEVGRMMDERAVSCATLGVAVTPQAVADALASALRYSGAAG